MKLLIVDDELKTTEYLKKGLSEQGCTVDIAHDGLEGRHLALEHDYDVIVLDVMLPALDGFSLLREVRRMRQTPVIMLTARDRVEDRVKGLQDGADDYLVKPFSFLELMARIQALARRGRAQEPMQLRIANLHIDLLARKAWRASTASSANSLAVRSIRTPARQALRASRSTCRFAMRSCIGSCARPRRASAWIRAIRSRKENGLTR